MNDRLKHIYEVALVALAENGYHGTSLRDIAQAVGIQTPSLYNYFSGKQDLLFHLMRSVMEELIAQTQAAVTGAGEDPMVRLRAAISAFVLFNTTRPNEAAVSDAGLSILDEHQRAEIIQLRDSFDAIFVELLEQGQREDVFTSLDPTIVKNTITSACARIYLWYRPSGRYDAEQLAASLSAYLTAGLLPTTSSTEVPS